MKTQTGTDSTAAQPIIGITTYGRVHNGRYFLPETYILAIRQAGGTAVMLPPGESHPEGLLAELDGLVLSGGGDINPRLYNAQMHSSIYSVDDERDAFEMALARQALAWPKPVLAICRGLQVMTVATGGDLIVHIPEASDGSMLHRQDGVDFITHPVRLSDGSRLRKIFGESDIRVASKHHQAANQVPEEWRISARAPDGIIEALEHRRHPWLFAVQWHPELPPGDAIQQRLFRAFIRESMQIRLESMLSKNVKNA